MKLICKSGRRRVALLAIVFGLGGHGAAAAQGSLGTGMGGFPGSGSIGTSAGLGSSARGGQFPGRGSLIGDGMGGFTIYEGRSRSRYLGPAQGPGSVYRPGGGTSAVIGNGNGGSTVSGPTGTFQHWGAPRRDFSEHR